MALVVASSVARHWQAQMGWSTTTLLLLQHLGVGLWPVAAVLWILAVGASCHQFRFTRMWHSDI